MTSRNPTISLRLAGDPAARLIILDHDETWATPERERLALPISALGFWVALRSLPHSVEMREENLCSRLGLTRHTLHKLAQTLEDHGRLHRESERDDRGQFTLSVWTMHVEPLPPVLRSRRVRKRATRAVHAPDSPCTGKSYTEKNDSVVVDKKISTTTTAVAAATAANLIMPGLDLFDEAQQDTFRQMLGRSGRPDVEQQLVLDELVYAVRRGEVRKPVGYLFRLIQRATDGQYLPDGALIVARERRDAAAAEAAKLAAEKEMAERRARRADPAAEERARAAASAAIASIGGLFAPRPRKAEESEDLDLGRPEIPAP